MGRRLRFHRRSLGLRLEQALESACRGLAACGNRLGHNLSFGDCGRFFRNHSLRLAFGRCLLGGDLFFWLAFAFDSLCFFFGKDNHVVGQFRIDADNLP